MNRLKHLILGLAFALCPLLTAGAYAEAPNLLTYQGRLKEGGQAVTGNRAVEIFLCDDETAGTCHTSGSQSVAVSNGLFRSTFTVPAAANFGAGNWWLEIKIGADTLAPRERLTSNAYALFAATAAYASNIAAAEGSNGVTISSNLFVSGGLAVDGSTLVVTNRMVGINTAAPQYPLHVQATTSEDVLYLKDNGANVSIKMEPQVNYNAKIEVQNTGAGLTFEIGSVPAVHISSALYAGFGTVAPAARVHISSGAGETGNLLVISTGSSDVIRMTGAGEIYANYFSGDGSLLTNLPAAGGGVAKTGDTMTGQLTLAGSTLTVTGTQFSVAGATFTISAGKIGIGTASPMYPLTIGVPEASSATAPAAAFFGVTGAAIRPYFIVRETAANVEVLSGADTTAGNHGFTGTATNHRFDLRSNNIQRLSVAPEGSIGIGTISPAYRLHISSAAGEAGNIVVISTGSSDVVRMTGAGEIYANSFHGDGSALTGIVAVGDDLGNHTATQNLNMGAFGVTAGGQFTLNNSSLTLRTGGTMNFTADETGHVGINSLPDAAVGLNIYGASLYEPGIKLDYGGLVWALHNNNGLLTFTKTDGATMAQMYLSRGGDLTLPNGAFSVGASTLIVKNDRVGVKTSAPDQEFTVAGDISQTGVIISSGTGDNYFAGKVGIGTPAPAYELHVLGAGPVTGALESQAASTVQFNLINSAASWNFIVDSLDASKLKIAQGGSAKVTLDGTSLGIGTTSPDAGTKLHVSGGNIGLDNNTYLRWKNSGGGMSDVMWVGADDKLNFRLTNPSTYTFQSYGGAALVSIMNSGKVGVGNADPAYQLDVLDSIRAYTPAGGNGRIILGDGDINHGMGIAPTTDTFGLITANSGTGGLNISGFSSAAGATAVYLGGVIGDADPTDTVPAVQIDGSKKNGVTWQALGAAETILGVRNNLGSNLVVVMGNGDVGIGDLTPSYKLDVTGYINASSGLCIGDNCKSSWASMDNLGDHTATQNLNLAQFSAVNVASMTMVGKGLQIGTDLTSGASGIFISTGGALQTVGAGHGPVAGNARGEGAVDLQTIRGAATQVASGKYAAIGGGHYNTASGLYATIPGGSFNTASAPYSFAAGYGAKATAQGAFAWGDSQSGNPLDNNVQDRVVFKAQGGFLVTGSSNPVLSGSVDRGIFVTGGGLLGISTGSPQAALDVVSAGAVPGVSAQIWRNSAGAVVSSMTSTGLLVLSSVTASGSVGVGTLSPRSALDVWGNGLYLGKTGAVHGSVSADDSLYLNIDANNDQNNAFLEVRAGVASVMYVGQSKVVGLGTTNPLAALDVVSTGTATNVYAQVWRNGSAVIVASMTSLGLMEASFKGPSFSPVTLKNGDYTALLSDEVILVDSSGVPVTITLPTAAGIAGKKYTVKAVVYGNTITVEPAGAETLDGAANYGFLGVNESINIISDGANWFIISNN